MATQVGPYPAALTWADPDESGVRTHNLDAYSGGPVGSSELTDEVFLHPMRARHRTRCPWSILRSMIGAGLEGVSPGHSLALDE